MEKLNNGQQPTRSGRASQSECSRVFTTLLSGLYNSKKTLLADLPFIASKASAAEVRYMILESGTIINGQVLRICLAQATLDLTFSAERPVLNSCLDLDGYLKNGITVSSAGTDVIILMHLVIAEQIEIEAFSLLARLAKQLGAPKVVKLMDTCNDGAVKNKQALNAMLNVHAAAL